jgi:predicted Zn-dependent peptidase
MSDLQAFTREDAEAFYREYYVPANMTVAIVGDVKAEEVIPLVETYFGRIPAGPKPDPLRTVEPPQTAEKSVVLTDPSQPAYMEGYHRPDVTSPEDPIYDVIADVLSTGRTARLYRNLVRDKKIAATAGVLNGFPGAKYPTLIGVRATPAVGHTNAEVQTALREQLERLKTEPLTDDELKMVKTRAKADLIRSLGSNSGLARQLAVTQARQGDWREMFRYIDRLEKVTKEDVMRVAKVTFVAQNRTVGMIEHTDAAAAGK